MAATIPAENPDDTDVFDVVVVGGGAAGLAAAARAAQRGARCLILEAAVTSGGAMARAVGSMAVCHPDNSNEIADTVQTFLEDIDHYLDDDTRRAQPRRLREALAAQSGATLDWLRSLGVPFAGPYREDPHRVPRLYAAIPDGRRYVDALMRTAIDSGAVLRTGARARGLLLSASRRIRGVRYVHAGEDREAYAERAIVLATGDFSANNAWRLRFLGEAIERSQPVVHTNRGDGHAMALEFGGSLENAHGALSPQVRFVSHPRFDGHQQELTAVVTSSNLNSLGRRAMARALLAPSNELFGSGAVLVSASGDLLDPDNRGQQLAMQPNQSAFVVMDSRWRSGMALGHVHISSAPTFGFATLDDYLHSRPDLVTTAPTLPELADALGLEDSGPITTNRVADVLDAPPFVALGPAKPLVTVLEGAVAIADDHRVLGADGEPSEGLYAVGAVGQGGLSLWGHGLHLSWALTSGRVVGESLTV